MCVCVFCCFFQAEDGIRDLVRSRGLGDVYKRQAIKGSFQKKDEDSKITTIPMVKNNKITGIFKVYITLGESIRIHSVSYTHLTLPTSDLV